MEKRKITRIPGGMVTRGGKTVEVMECCQIDHGNQGVTKVYVMEKPPKSEAERQERRRQIDAALHKMWLSVQESRVKQADAAG